MDRFAAGRRWLPAIVAVLAVLSGRRGALASRQEGPRLDGLVVDPSGSPIPNAVVTAGQARTRTDGSGRFRLPGPAQWVTARADGWLPRTRTASPAGQVVIRADGVPEQLDGLVQRPDERLDATHRSHDRATYRDW